MTKDKTTIGNDPSEGSHSDRKPAPANPAEKQPGDPASCGVVMPISPIDGCSAEHWLEVKSIIFESVKSITSPSFAVKLVSDDEASGVIQKRIIQNIYSCDIVICDVSAKNPNVMFELGMRLAFDKPTIIIKDDKTDYSFDTGIIEHIPYPRDLRFNRIVNFKNSLADKVAATYRLSKANPEHSTFLKNFGTFQVAKISESVVSADKMTFTMFQELQKDISDLRRTVQMSNHELNTRIRSQELLDDPVMRETRKTIGTIKIKQIIEDTIITNKNSKFDLVSLKDNENFIDYLMKSHKLGGYFQSKSEVLECVNRIINEMI